MYIDRLGYRKKIKLRPPLGITLFFFASVKCCMVLYGIVRYWFKLMLYNILDLSKGSNSKIRVFFS